MSPQINEELILLLMSMYGGLVLILCYDSIRIFRRLFSASIFRVIVEDFIFWTVAAIFMFNILLKYNYGRPRYFAIGAALGVMALFEWFIGRHIVDKLSGILKKIMNTLLKPLKKVWKVIKLKYSRLMIHIRKKVKKCPDKHEQTREDKVRAGRSVKGCRNKPGKEEQDRHRHRVRKDHERRQQAD
ncbi:MAG: spore cortex biosynthesis protein YabQ [Eubacterium sp.]